MSLINGLLQAIGLRKDNPEERTIPIEMSNQMVFDGDMAYHGVRVTNILIDDEDRSIDSHLKPEGHIHMTYGQTLIKGETYVVILQVGYWLVVDTI